MFEAMRRQDRALSPEGARALLDKVAPEHLQAGLAHLKEALPRVSVPGITVQHLTGKGRA